MAEKKITAVEIQKLLKEGSLIVGTERIIKGLKKGDFERILVSKNTPEKVIENIQRYAKIGSVKVVKLKYDNEELGVVCKKPFSISVVGILKEKKIND